MYTILINKDKSLTTSVKTTLLRNSQTDEIQFLYAAPELEVIEPESDSDEEPLVKTTYIFSAVARYEIDGIEKTESLVTDEELYKGRVRFRIPRSSAFFNNRGVMHIWLEITTETIVETTTITIDDETGEETRDVTTEESTESFTTLPTELFIEEVPHHGHCRHNDNTIRITRGDSLTVNVTLTDNDGFPYEPVEGDTVWFTVKKSAVAEDVLIRKKIDITNLVLDLVEEDTRDLAFGEYKYEIEVITGQDDHYTVIKNAPFIIMEELH